MRSLRTWLLVTTLTASVLAWGGAAAFTYRDLRHEVDALFDARLAEAAQALLKQATHEMRERKEREEHDERKKSKKPKKSKKHKKDYRDEDHEDDKRHHHYELPLYFQVLGADGEVLSRSSPPLTTAPLAIDEGFATRIVDGRELRVLALWNKRRTIEVQVAEGVENRATITGSVLRNALGSGVLVLPFLVLALVIAVSRGLRPLRRICADVAQRAPDNLTSLAAGDAPEEVQPLMEALNDLLARLDRALQSERRFTADAAHELRTPLAAVKTQAQVALGATDEASRRHALAGVIRGVDQATHLVTQLLTLARLDPEAPLPAAQIAVQSLIAEVAANIAPAALAKGIELTLDDTAAAKVHGDADMLRILLRNLIDNAVRYTPEGGHVRLAVMSVGASLALTVEDDGPGLNEAQQAVALQRFARVARASGGGSGLGLSIVERIATLHGATVTLASGRDGKGLLVTVMFGASSA